MPGESGYTDRHRADYILECGVWRARCRLCNWEVTDPVRRQAATLFRYHIRAAASLPSEGDTQVIDLRTAPDRPPSEVGALSAPPISEA
jgi:hypothetical protein